MFRIEETTIRLGRTGLTKRIKRRSGKLKNDNLNLLDNEFNSDVIRIKGKVKGLNKKRHFHDNYSHYNNANYFDN